MTRFALVARPGPPPRADRRRRHLAGRLHLRTTGSARCSPVLTELAVRGVNLTRIESRPTGERLGRYVFFLDCAGHVAEARMGEALQGLHRVCADVRFLGSYPRAGADTRPATTRTAAAVNAPPGTSDRTSPTRPPGWPCAPRQR